MKLWNSSVCCSRSESEGAALSWQHGDDSSKRGSGRDSGSFKRQVYNQLHRKQTSSLMLEARTWNQQSVSLIATSLLTKEYTSVCGNLIMGIHEMWYLLWGCRCRYYLCFKVIKLGNSHAESFYEAKLKKVAQILITTCNNSYELNPMDLIKKIYI